MNRFISFGLATASAVLMIPPVQAQNTIDPDQHAIILNNVNVHPASIREARKTLDRIKVAALTLCGAPHGSSTYMRRAVMKSECFRDSLADAVRKIDDPLINRLHDRPY
ncbi:MAG: UrcA family protein [Erythrobacter sp.]